MPLNALKEALQTLIPQNGDKPRVRVLVVEDHDATRELWCAVLSGAGHLVRAASSVREALPLIQDSDILLLDWLLGEQTAEPVLATWEENHSGKPCAVISGRLSEQEIRNLYAAGVFNVLLKPTSIEVLTSIVRHYSNDVVTMKEVRRLKEEVRALRRVVLVMMMVMILSVVETNIVDMIARLF